MASGASPRAVAAFPFARLQELILPVGIVASVLVILIPLPAALMDLLLAANITIAVIMLLTTIYVRTPLEFNIFPSLLLATTLFRLVLNVATTRLILTRAETDGLSAAGRVVESFGNFVAAEKIVVGLIIFVIIVVIQFLVITKGATRISEVAARFNLDGMPGKQMAIDADLNAGIIDEREALRRREEVAQQAEFYGAMDGASKFVRGDAIAGMVIIAVNIVGGLFIGVVEAGMSVGAASALFTKLTIGDGLVSQLPAFLISLAAGLLVTRSTQKVNLPSEFIRQLFSRPQALTVAAAFLGVLIFTTLPPVPLTLIGASCVGLAVLLTRRTARDAASEEAKKQADAAKQPAERVEDYLIVEPMDMEIGVGLIRLADRGRGGDLLDRIHRVRKEVAGQIGIILPKVRIRDNFQLGQTQYRIKIAGTAVAEGVVRPGMLMAVDNGNTTGRVAGTPAQDPTFGAPAVWISPAECDKAKTFGYTVVEPGAVLATHLLETVRRHADEILTRDAARRLIDQLRETSPAVVEELIPDVMRLAEVQQVLQMLLREQVPIRQLGVILETLGDYAPRSKDPILLTEFVRARLSRTISTRYRDAQNRLYVVTLDPELEDRISAGFEHTGQGLFIRMSPQAVEATCRQIAEEIEHLTAAGRPPIVLVSPGIRAALREMTVSRLPNLIVLSYNEITRDTRIESVAMSAETS